MSAAGDPAPRLRRLRVVQLVLVASLVAMPALNIAGSIAGAAVQAAGSLGWLVSTVLIAVFVVLAHGVATGLGRPPSAPRGQLVALTLIPCVSVVGIPYALHQLAKVFAELSHDEGVVRRTTIAAVLYPVIAFGGGVAGTGILMATLPAALDREPASDLAIALAVSLPSLLAQAALAAATYFVTTAAAAAVDLKRDLPAAGAGGPAAIAV